VPDKLFTEVVDSRRLALNAEAPRSPEPPPRPRLKPKMATAEAFAAVAAACLQQIAFHAPRVHRDGGVEDVHRTRVAVRRLRAVLSVFRRAIDGRRLPFEDDLRWLQDKLGAVRDWDVFRARAVQPIEGEHTDVALVDEAGGMARDYAHLELRIALESARSAALWRSMMRWLRSLARGREQGGKLDRPIAKYARRELRRRDRKLRRRGRRIAALDEEELHTLRIGAKKLRYAAEFFCDLYPEKQLERVLARIKSLQDLLGGLNDARTARTLLDRLEPRRGAGQPAIAFAHGDGLVEGAVLMRAKAERARVAREWQRYEKAGKPWK
jgi:triphosphatase